MKNNKYILVINSGSSSLKFKLYSYAKTPVDLYGGMVDRIGISAVKDHDHALKIALSELVKNKIIKSLQDIHIVGHRVVHGCDKHTQATIINKEIIEDIKELCEIAPLHNPPNLKGILACQKLLTHVKQVAVFDTGFHAKIPKKSFLYAIPSEFYTKNKIRRYGFHGISHEYLNLEASKILKSKSLKIISCHLGNGASVCAINKGVSIDTSMGYTPLEGLVMGTRSGDIDPEVVLEIAKSFKKNTKNIDEVIKLTLEVLNKKSGLKAISNLSSDMRDLWANHKKNPSAKLAIEIYCYRVAKYIGAYAAALKGVNAIIFSGGIGQNAHYIRSQVCSYLRYLGVELQEKSNKQNLIQINSKKSLVKVLVIPANEELMIAKKTYKLTNKK